MDYEYPIEDSAALNDADERLPRFLNIAELAAIFDFDEADLLANRKLRYSGRQHRLRGAALGLLLITVFLVISIPVQITIGNELGYVAAPCFAVLGLIGILAAIGSVASFWNTVREGVVTPVVRYDGFVDLRKRAEAFSLESEAFSIAIAPEAAEQFIPGDYTVYYVPNYVADRAKLFSIEPTM